MVNAEETRRLKNRKIRYKKDNCKNGNNAFTKSVRKMFAAAGGHKNNYVKPTEELLALSVKLIVDYCNHNLICQTCKYRSKKGGCVLKEPYTWEIEE